MLLASLTMQLFHKDIGLTSVRCRGLLVPHRALASVLARSTRPLLFENNDENYRYTKRGSCTLRQFEQEHFVVFAGHQSDGYPDTIRIVRNFTGGPALAADMLAVVNPCDGEEIEDLRALRFSIAHYGPQDLSDFFPTSTQHLPPVQAALMLISVGAPTQASVIDYEPAHIYVGTVPISCVYERKSALVAGLHTVKINPAHATLTHLDLDGMSGAPIFSIDGAPGSYMVNFLEEPF